MDVIAVWKTELDPVCWILQAEREDSRPKLITESDPTARMCGQVDLAPTCGKSVLELRNRAGAQLFVDTEFTFPLVGQNDIRPERLDLRSKAVGLTIDALNHELWAVGRVDIRSEGDGCKAGAGQSS
jgi:hypothetical protein